MLLGLLLAVIVGITLGLVGSGGTILTVPILVYVMQVDPVLATTYSLFAVGVTALVGAFRGLHRGEVELAKVVQFGLPSLITVFLTRTFLLPLVPDIIVISGYHFHQSFILMLLLAVVMMASSISMIRGSKIVDDMMFSGGDTFIKSIGIGIVVGLVTGVVGAGGGFLIIPTLTNFFGMPMRRAVSTSLFVIAINSFFGVLGDIDKVNNFDWQLVGSYTVFTLIGIFVGFFLSDYIGNQLIKKSFGYFILIVAIYIICEELLIQSSGYINN